MPSFPVTASDHRSRGSPEKTTPISLKTGLPRRVPHLARTGGGKYAQPRRVPRLARTGGGKCAQPRRLPHFAKTGGGYCARLDCHTVLQTSQKSCLKFGPLPQPRHCERPQVAWQPRKNNADIIKTGLPRRVPRLARTGGEVLCATGLPRRLRRLARTGGQTDVG